MSSSDSSTYGNNTSTNLSSHSHSLESINSNESHEKNKPADLVIIDVDSESDDDVGNNEFVCSNTKQFSSRVSMNATRSPPKRTIIEISDDNEDSEDDANSIEIIRVVSPKRFIPQAVSRTSQAQETLNRPPKKCKNIDHLNGDYVYGIKDHDALKEQDRLLQESILHVRKREELEKQNRSAFEKAKVTTITEPVQDFSTLPNDHWLWSDPYARLGLPQRSSFKLVKHHYRKLCLIYHPDKTNLKDGPDRFQAIKGECSLSPLSLI